MEPFHPRAQFFSTLRRDSRNILLRDRGLADADYRNPKCQLLTMSGIHGRPFKVWEGAEFTADPAGYCPHSNTMFLGWHRPYLALFEVSNLNYDDQCAMRNAQ